MAPLLTIALVLLLQGGAPRQIRMTDVTYARFASRVADYVETRRRIAAGFGEPTLCADLEERFRQTAALAAAIRAARPLTEGHIFTPSMATPLRDLIATAVRHGFEGAAAFDVNDEEFDVEVSGTISCGAGRAPAAVIARALPLLPWELEYRFVGRDLVLVDIGANLVVDILRDAVPLTNPAPRSATPCAVHPEIPACWMS